MILRNPKVKDDIFFAVIESNEPWRPFVGSVALFQTSAKNRDGSLIITLAKPHWSKGYGTEVLKFVIDYGFRQLALHRISLSVFATNERAKALYDKL